MGLTTRARSVLLSIGFIWSLADLDDEQLASMTLALYGDCMEEGERGEDTDT